MRLPWILKITYMPGTGGKSMFKTTTSTVTDIHEITFQPVTFYLDQNYPNPFNPITSIQFGLAKASRVRVSLFNLLGQEIVLLLDQDKPAGNHKIQVDCGELGTGMYFYRMTTEGFVQTRKLIVIK